MRKEEILVERGYMVSEKGIPYNKKGRKLGSVNNQGYLSFNIRIKGKITHCPVHRLQAYQKYGNDLYNKGMVTRHLNGNKLDNSWENIAIGTHSDNMMDIPKQIRIKRAHHATKFNRKYNVEEVVKYHSVHNSYRKTMEKFNITSKGTLHNILNRK